MGRRWSAPCGPGVPGGRDPGPSPARAATSGPSIKTSNLVWMVLLVLVEPATNSRAYALPDVRKMEFDIFKLCEAGYYRASETGACKECQEGVDFTNHSNNLSSCFPCSVCKDDKEEKSRCTTTRDAVCQCKPGTFQNPQFPEHCVRCRSGCHSGFVEESPCVPWSDRKCVHKESGTKATRETPASAEPVTGNLSTTTSPHPSSDHDGYKKVVVGVVFGFFLMIVLVPLALWKSAVLRNMLAQVKNCLRCGQDSAHTNSVSCDDTLGGPEAQDNDHNEILSSRNSSFTLDLEQQRDRQDLETVVTEESPGEITSLLLQRPAETEDSRRTRRLIPADGTNTSETLLQFFNCQQNVIPYKSWNKLMRQLGLTNNEIEVIKCETEDRGDVLYQMMEKWLNKMGRDASINSLLDALETLGERTAREKIEDHMVRSGKFIYQEDGADTTATFL